MNNLKQISELGRTATEILGVLAIMGLLSIAAVLGYKHAISKICANKIIHDGRIVYTDTLSQPKLKTDWEKSDILSESGKDFYYYTDFAEHSFVKVLDVEKNTCIALLSMSNDKLHFLTTENKPFDMCKDTNDMIIDYEDNGLITECATSDDCDTNNYCGNGQCKECEDGRELNDSKTGCKCFENEELTCSDQKGNEWCCGKDQDGNPTICGTEYEQCIVSNGICSYKATEQEKISYSDCSYKVTGQQKTSYSDCSYSVSKSGDVEPVQDCPASQYCYLSFKESDCSVAAHGRDIDTIIYGVCIQQTSNDGTYCKTTFETDSVIPVQDCPNANEYCYLSFKESNCSVAAHGRDIDTIIYGVCIQQTSNDGTYCKTTFETDSVIPVQDCPASQYCYLKWETEDCSQEFHGSMFGLIYGRCLSQNRNNAVCQ